MASSVTSKLLLIFSVLFLAATLTTVSARPGLPFHPCNTLIVSTYSFSLLPQNPHPNPTHPQFLIVSTDLHPFHHHLRHRRFLPLMVNRIPNLESSQPFEAPKIRPDFSPLGYSSLRDRTKDILSVVASLLFGAACGALTAGTMYLIWSLFNHRHESYRSLDGFSSDNDDDNNDDDDDDDIFNPKKKGYVTAPTAPAKVVDSIPVPAAAPAPAPAAA